MDNSWNGRAAGTLMVMTLGLLWGCGAAGGDDAADASSGGGGEAAEGEGGGGASATGGGVGQPGGGGGDGGGSGGGPAFVYEDVVEGCVKLVACGAPDASGPNPLRIGVPGLGNSLDICVTSVLDLLADAGLANDGTRAYLKVIDCARQHADCTGFVSCLAYPYTDQSCEDEGPRCDGDTLVGCTQVGGTKAMVTECAVLGMTCVDDGPAPQCGTGATCAVNDPVSCDGEDAALICQNGGRVRLLCPPGTKCTPGSAQPCAPAGETCDQPGLRRCTPEGNAATCYPDAADPTKGHERVVDCVSQHAVCGGEAENFRCVPAATECTGGENDTCLDDGSGFTGCAHGSVITVPCARLGRTTCTYNAGHAGCE